MFRSALVVTCAVSAALAACAGAAGVARALAPAPTARLAKAADGHFWAQATGGRRGVSLLVDTGASTVALTPADARALGVDTDRLDYSRPIVTAAGRTVGAPVMLARVSVGRVAVDGVPALVVRKGLERSLLGMSFLGRLKGFSADADALTLVR